MKIYSIGKTKFKGNEVIYLEFRLETQEDKNLVNYIFNMMMWKEYQQNQYLPKEFDYVRHKRSVIIYNPTDKELTYKVKKSKDNATATQ